MKAGFIGLGAMGAPIARRLARCGFSVTGYDAVPATLEQFDEPGTERASSAAQAARGSDMLGVCVRTDAQVQDVFADLRVADALAPGALVILHSTIAPDLAVRLAGELATRGIGFIDVGVSGGGPAAIEGQLSLFVGGSEADVARAKPWFDAIARSVAHLGPVGKGLEGKLINNLISIANYGMSAAIVDVADGLGFEREGLLAALMAGSAQSFALKVAPGFITPRPGRDKAADFMDLHDLLKKDVDHCRDLHAPDTAAMDALLASCEAMLARLRRAAALAEGSAVPADPDAVIDAYFAAVRARDLDAFTGLFAPDAVFDLPNGTRVEGREAIRAVQAKVFSAGSPWPMPIARFRGPEGIAVEIEARLPDGSVRHTTNIYRFDEAGLIRSLGVTMRA